MRWFSVSNNIRHKRSKKRFLSDADKRMNNLFFTSHSCTRLVIKLTIVIWPVPIPHLSAGVWNIPLHRSELIGPKGGKPCDGNSDPEDRNTLVVFLRFFHLARRFWNHTYATQNRRYQSLSLSSKTKNSRIFRVDKKILYNYTLTLHEYSFTSLLFVKSFNDRWISIIRKKLIQFPLNVFVDEHEKERAH